MNFDKWAGNVKEQMERKGRGFDPADRWHSTALVGLVISEIVEAAQEVKRHHLAQPKLVAGELADALIRLGHFAAVTGVVFAGDYRYEGLQGFNDLGDQHRADGQDVDLSDFWRTLNGVQWLVRDTSALYGFWSDSAWSATPGSTQHVRFGIGLRRCVVDICAVGRILGLDLDAAMQERIAYNETRPKRYNLATGQMD